MCACMCVCVCVCACTRCVCARVCVSVCLSVCILCLHVICMTEERQDGLFIYLLLVCFERIAK